MRAWSTRIAAAALTLACAQGCASSTRIYVRSTEGTNDGSALYMMVRAANGSVLVTESYQQAATKLFHDPPDTTVLASQPIFPGNNSTLTLDGADGKDIVIYFFFTDPGQDWRVYLHKPLPSEVYIDLGQHQVDHVAIRKR